MMSVCGSPYEVSARKYASVTVAQLSSERIALLLNVEQHMANGISTEIYIARQEEITAFVCCWFQIYIDLFPENIHSVDRIFFSPKGFMRP